METLHKTRLNFDAQHHRHHVRTSVSDQEPFRNDPLRTKLAIRRTADQLHALKPHSQTSPIDSSSFGIRVRVICFAQPQFSGSCAEVGADIAPSRGNPYQNDNMLLHAELGAAEGALMLW